MIPVKKLGFAQLFAFCLLFLPFGKGGDGLFAQTPGEWTWMHGDSTPNSLGSFGIQGVTNPTNKPPALYEPCEWTDKNGNFWLFGGGGSALWKYDPVINEWTWIKGPANALAVYGTQGVPSSGNHPGSRSNGIITWVDASGNLWLFGGSIGTTSAGIQLSNDLWKYDIPTNEWTWMKGPNTGNDPGLYGTQGVASPANLPPARYETSCSWTDNAGNLWLYGGLDNNSNRFGDLWKYDIATNDWTWMHGANTVNAAAVYGTLGVADPANTPGGRFVYCSWTDLSGNLWLFGGAFAMAAKRCNDLWKYDIAANQWIWVKGANTINNPGNYGTRCVSANSNVPPAKFESRARVRDACGNFWCFGGSSPGGGSYLNDLWHYNVSNNQWTWVSGDNVPNQAGVYGAQTVSDPASKPQAKIGSVAWMDNKGYIWIFGGLFQQTTPPPTTNYLYNDLFRYVPDTACVPVGSALTVSSDTSICIGQSITLTASGGTSYLWSPGGQSTSSVVVNPAISTTYTMIGSGSCGSGSYTVTVTVDSLPVPAINGNDIICVGDKAILTASGGSNYLWNTAQTDASITVNPPTSTTYTTIISIGTCTATATFAVTVKPSPTVTAWNNVTITAGSSTTLNSSGTPSSVTYNWSPAIGLSCITCQNPIANPMVTTEYCVTVMDSNNCINTVCVIVTVIPEPPLDCSGAKELYLPNAFSPNNDGENDEFCLSRPAGIPAGQGGIESCIKELTITIYDRWGETVFESTDPKFCWDGIYDGKQLNTAVFVYYLDATLISGQTIIKKGNLSLIK